MHGVRRFVARLALVAVVSAVVVTAQVRQAAASTPGPARYVALASAARLLDSRDGTVPEPGTTRTVTVAGRAGVPVHASAVALTVTATEVTSPGFVSVYPAGRARPSTSTLNVVRGDTRANLTLVALGGGAVEVFVQAGAHVVVDVSGYFEEVSGPVAAGRIVAAGPTRLLDTRDGTGAPAGLRQPGDTVRVAIDPAGGAVGAAVLSLTATEALAAGFLAAFPAGTAYPGTSNLNLPAGGTRANLVIVPVGAGGVDVVTTAGGHVVIDLLGVVTGPVAPAGRAGLFVGLDSPARLLDTREEPIGRLGLGGEVAVRVGGRGGVPVGAAAAALNVTLVEVAGPGYATVWPDGQPWPGSSNLNVEQRRQIVAGAAISGLSGPGGPGGAGWVQARSMPSADVVIDVTGWFLPDGDPGSTTAGGPTVRPVVSGVVVDVVDTAGFDLSPVAVAGRSAPPLPAGSGAGRRVVFSGAQQRVWAVEADGTVVRSWLVSGSTVPASNEWPGTYTVYLRQELTWAYNGLGMLQWFIAYRRTPNGFDIGFHQIPNDGAGVPVQSVAQLGQRRSAGCQRQAVEDSLFLWEWAPLGTTVVVV
jgi:hypothetical protein